MAIVDDCPVISFEDMTPLDESLMEKIAEEVPQVSIRIGPHKGRGYIQGPATWLLWAYHCLLTDKVRAAMAVGLEVDEIKLWTAWHAVAESLIDP